MSHWTEQYTKGDPVEVKIDNAWISGVAGPTWLDSIFVVVTKRSGGKKAILISNCKHIRKYTDDGPKRDAPDLRILIHPQERVHILNLDDDGTLKWWTGTVSAPYDEHHVVVALDLLNVEIPVPTDLLWPIDGEG